MAPPTSAITFDALAAEASGLLDRCRVGGVTLATGESCTGGLIAAILTEVAGSSDVVERGFVTYSNQAKIKVLDVKAETSSCRLRIGVDSMS